jgi:hypothetical protein
MKMDIEDYFSQDEHGRVNIRKEVAASIRNDEQILKILAIGSDNQYREAYCGAIDLLAEVEDIYLFRGIIDQCLGNDDWAEILLQAIACAYRIDAVSRFDLLNKALPHQKSRITKAALIDGLENLADEVDVNIVRQAIDLFLNDNDLYIRDYATTALGDILTGQKKRSRFIV